MIPETETPPAFTAMAIAFGACFFAVCTFGVGKLTGTLDPIAARRGVGAVLGLILVVTGNYLPKMRLFQPAFGSVYSDRIDRFAGQVFVLSGLFFTIVFLTAPADKIMTVAPFIVLLGFVTVFAGWVRWKASQAGDYAPLLTNGRLALALMLAAVFGICGIFIADAFWGDAVSRWMGILLPFAVFIFARRLRRRLHA